MNVKKMVIEVLNKARTMELHGIHQYMNQHYNLDNMDYGELAAKMKLIAIDEMRHAEKSFASNRFYGVAAGSGPWNVQPAMPSTRRRKTELCAFLLSKVRFRKIEVATKGYGLFTRTRALSGLSNQLPVGQNTAAPYANIIVALFQTQPAAGSPHDSPGAAPGSFPSGGRSES